MAKIIGNTTATPNPRPDWKQTDKTKADYIKNKPEQAKSINENSTDNQYPTAKSVYDFVQASSDYVQRQAKEYTDDIKDNLINDASDVHDTLIGLINENKNDIAVERERITNLASLPDGSTTGDAELLDIRVGADAVTYGSAGDAVRGQVESLHTRLDNLKFASKFPFEIIDLPPISENYGYKYEDGKCVKKTNPESGFSPITKCPKYLGFRIDGDARLYLYICTRNFH